MLQVMRTEIECVSQLRHLFQIEVGRAGGGAARRQGSRGSGAACGKLDLEERGDNVGKPNGRKNVYGAVLLCAATALSLPAHV